MVENTALPVGVMVCGVNYASFVTQIERSQSHIRAGVIENAGYLSIHLNPNPNFNLNLNLNLNPDPNLNSACEKTPNFHQLILIVCASSRKVNHIYLLKRNYETREITRKWSR